MFDIDIVYDILGSNLIIALVVACYNVFSKDWTPVGVANAVKTISIEKNTLFDDLSKNLENNEKLYDLIYDILIADKQRMFSISNPTVNLGAMYGIIKESNRNVCVSNRVFELIISDYFISKDEETNQRTSGMLRE